MDHPARTWADRWRVLRGSPPGPPDDQCFALLEQTPAEALNDLAAASNDNLENIRWWQEIATDPARRDLVPLRRTQFQVYRVLRDHGPLTDEDLAGRLQQSIRSVVPRRSELTRKGLVHEVGRSDPIGRRPAKLWAVVASDHIIHERIAAMQRGLRRKSLDRYTLDEKVQIVRYLVGLGDVNQALLDEHAQDATTKRMRREARAAEQEQERRRKELSDQIRQAERDASPDLNYLKAIRQIRSAEAAVRELGRVLSENVEGLANEGEFFIDPEHWPEARAHIRELITEAQKIEGNLTDFIGDSQEDGDWIDAEIVEDEDFELPPGDG